MSRDHHLLVLHLRANATQLLRFAAHTPLCEVVRLEIVLQPTERLTHGLLILPVPFQVLRLSLWTFTFAVVSNGIGVVGSVGRLIYPGTLLVIFPSVHHNLTLGVVTASEIAVLDVADTSKLVRYVLVGDLCALRKTTWLSRLDLTWMNCGSRHPRVHDRLSISRHGSLGYTVDCC